MNGSQPPPSHAVIGSRINDYQIVSLLAEGPTGTVYLARHPTSSREMVVKVLRPEAVADKTLVSRFLEDTNKVRALRHPGIVEVTEAGTFSDSGVPYVVMERLEGKNLAERLASGIAMPIDEAVEAACQIASALGAAHGLGLIHRNLKPENIFLIPDELHPAGMRVKVLDFGIASLRAGEMRSASHRTLEGALLASPPYMSPEQCRGIQDEIDHRADVYSLGILLYQMVCGAPPFSGENHADVVMMHLTQAPSPPRVKNSSVPVKLEGVILRALVKRREDRFPSMTELEAALRRAIGPVQAPSRRSTLRRRVEAGLDPYRASLFDLPVVNVPVNTEASRTAAAEAAAATERAASGRRRTAAFIAATVAALATAVAIALALAVR